MSRRRLLLPGLALLACLAAAAPAQAHQGDPHYLSLIKSVTPALPGLSVVMLNRDDRLAVTNRSRQTIDFFGYEGEPYLRFLPSGVVQRNVFSPATYLNDDRTGTTPVPKIADADKAPRWATVSEDGKFEFHDHRIHWMGAKPPPVITDPDKETKVDDWRVPMTAGADGKGAIAGTLYWTPLGGGGAPVAAIAGLAVLLLGSVALVVVVRRRRAAAGDEDGAGATEEREAW
jgi:hypothetical protein